MKLDPSRVPESARASLHLAVTIVTEAADAARYELQRRSVERRNPRGPGWYARSLAERDARRLGSKMGCRTAMSTVGNSKSGGGLDCDAVIRALSVGFSLTGLSFNSIRGFRDHDSCRRGTRSCQ
jgi:hypothetical protein